MTVAIDARIENGLAAVRAEEWDALVDANDPFLEWSFLRTLEISGAVGGASGWTPRFALARRQGELVGAIPAYLKTNSYGEFIFDWGWAHGAERAGIAYYPKVTVAVPFTPVTGQRLLVRADQDADQVIDALLNSLAGLAHTTGASSIHFLFCRPDEVQALSARGFLPRLSFQFHWHNRTPLPYRDFEDFLGAFRATNRKQVRKERGRAAEHGLRFATLEGPALGDREWDALASFYENNAERHGSHTYLPPRFFRDLRTHHARRVVATLAYRDERPVAGTLNFQRGAHLYGRYWGTTVDQEMLHFELCYYALIERAIASGLARFEAGAQGEHKLKRGLLPAATHSAHLILDRRLAAPVARFIARETEAVQTEIAAYVSHSPFALRG